jgi:hypothetical protein
VTTVKFDFSSRAEVKQFDKVAGNNCSRKWNMRRALGLVVGKATPVCALGAPTIGQASDAKEHQALSASALLPQSSPFRKIFLSVQIRQSSSGFYELRVIPAKRKWQVRVDQPGAADPITLDAGGGKFVDGRGDANRLQLKAFEPAAGKVKLVARVNGVVVFTRTEDNAGEPKGRQALLSVGNKAGKSATKAAGIFDNVTQRVGVAG